MNIRAELAAQMRKALKQGQKDRLRALRMLKAEFDVAQSSGKQFQEADVVKSHLKVLHKSLAEYERLGLEAQCEKLRQEIQIVEQFLPPQMSRQELEALIVQIIEAENLGPRDVGRLMKAVMSQHGSAVDGRLAQEIARQKLAERG